MSGKKKNALPAAARRTAEKMMVPLIIYDVIAVNAAYVASLWLRFDCRFTMIPREYLMRWLHFAPIYTVFCVVLLLLLRLYHSLWQYASYTELVHLLDASAITAVFHLVGCFFFVGRMPISYWILGAIFQFILLAIPRFGYRSLRLMYHTMRSAKAPMSRVMLIGAGDAGRMILRDIQTSDKLHETVVCVIDDDKEKWTRWIDGVPIIGGREAILDGVEKYRVDKIYLAIPSAPAAARRDILQICKETSCELKTLPSITQLVDGTVQTSRLRNVAIDDLLGREPIKADLNEVFAFIHDKVILVTGGGGSIGSELCRQIAAHDPRQLIIFEIYENNAYAIQLELKEKYPELNLVVLIGSVRDSRRLYSIFSEYRPQIVYHAAAHKHVPLMEDSPCESIKNNAIGTYKTAYAAMIHGCERFILVSTDKAVNPTNVMGASKRICEMIIQSFDEKIKQGKADEIPQIYTHRGGHRTPGSCDFASVRTEFVAVRFGNVLGSNGSVVPIFKRQIEKGGPVTVTHPDIIRYFMTVSEAVSLILLAGTYANGGEIFVLDMGEPVKIDTLARNLIRLSGLTPDVDIKIEYTGLRPGEKLYEEKLMAEEGLKKTNNDLIHIGEPIPFDTDTFFRQLETLSERAHSNDRNIRTYIMEVVSTYHPAAPLPAAVHDEIPEYAHAETEKELAVSVR